MIQLHDPSQTETDGDKLDVKSVESGNTKPIYESLKSNINDVAGYDEIFYLPLQDSPQKIAKMLISKPERYRFRNENGFGFLFDRETFNITMLRQDELDEINKNLPHRYKQT